MIAHAIPVARTRSRWQVALAATALATLGVLLLFARDIADMARIWWTSSTYEHCLLIVPIAFWLVWIRRCGLVRLTPGGWAPGLWLVAGGAMCWLIGEAGGAAVLRHLGLVVMVQGAIVACLGSAIAGALAFPIAYLLFLVPFGEAFEPPLQTLTATITGWLLALCGVPATIDGVFISAPSGVFEVAEACSGVKFLVAMLAFGALVANIGFRSWPRRIALMAAAAVLPILANGVRAWGTIMVSERSGAAFGSHFDHVFYGWVFFGLVIALLLAIAWAFFDRPIDAPWFDGERLTAIARRNRRRSPLAMAVAAVFVAAAAPAWAMMFDAAGDAALPASSLPQVAGWHRVAGSASPRWTPQYAGADRLLQGRYADDHGNVVDLAAALFADQRSGRSLVGYGQGAAGPASGWVWSADLASPASGRALRIVGPGGAVRDVLLYDRIGTVTTGSETRVKLETLRLHLLGDHDAAAAVLVSAEEGEGGRAAAERFVATLGSMPRLADRLIGR